jgi:Rad52/22 family double-strand break repair protein
VKSNPQSKVLDAVSVPALNPAGERANHKQTSDGDREFSDLLQQFGAGIRKEEIKQREGWTDRRGQVHYVDYVEWPTVADLLDKLAPTWSHAVRNIVQIGQFVAATAAITINGVTREGVGTGSAESETGIKKAEHDALKRAAIKFGIARDLYRDEDKPGDSSRELGRRGSSLSTANPKAQSIASLVSPKQLYLIRREADSRGLDPEAVCQKMHQTKLEEISKRAASALIDYLKSLPVE